MGGMGGMNGMGGMGGMGGSLEWVVMIMMKMINKEILMILKSKKKLNKNLQHDCIKSP